MKMNAIIVDVITQSHLFEMAFDKAGLEKKFSDACFRTAEHLVKILAFDDISEYRGWTKEIDALLKPAMVGRWNHNKTLKPERIKKLLWDPYFGQGVEGVTLMVKSLIDVDEYSVPRTHLTDAEIYLIVDDIYDEVSTDGALGSFKGIKYYLNSKGVNW